MIVTHTRKEANNMCQIPQYARNMKTTTATNKPTRSVEEMLQEIAFVLSYTRKVKASILRDLAQTTAATATVDAVEPQVVFSA